MDPKHWTLLKWLDDPVPFFNWRAGGLHSDVVHPQDMTKLDAMATEFAEAMGPTPASRLVAKIWIDPAFKKRALEDPIAASLEVGIK